MWAKLLAIVKRIGAFIQHLFGFKPDMSSVSERIDVGKSVEKDKQTISQPVDRPLALPITNRYENIDWENKPPPYRKKKGVLSYREAQFHRILVRLFGKKYHILSMVRMADVIYLRKNAEDRKFHNINISSKHFDFVFCDKFKFTPMLVIELDDPTHLYHFRKEIDDFKNKACEEAGLPLLRFKVQHTYNEKELKEKIRQKISDYAQTDAQG